ncbi:hypothetical protein CFY91_02655 [Pseudomonas fluvialis]|nr:hypothetical protein CFY91_02655 [Pseudomonas fluvialis]
MKALDTKGIIRSFLRHTDGKSEIAIPFSQVGQLPISQQYTLRSTTPLLSTEQLEARLVEGFAWALNHRVLNAPCRAATPHFGQYAVSDKPTLPSPRIPLQNSLKWLIQMLANQRPYRITTRSQAMRCGQLFLE